MKKLLALLLIAILVIPAMAMADDVELTLSFWGSDTRVGLTTTVAQMYMDENPGVTITLLHRPSDYWDILVTEFAAESAPDIIQMGGNFGDYTNYIMPLNDYVDSGVIDTEYYDKAMLTTVSVDGSTYGMCLGANKWGFVYNETMLNEYGAPLPDETLTWENLGEYLAQVQAVLPEGKNAIYDASQRETGFLGYYLGCNGEIFWDGDQTTMTAETVAAYMQMWDDFRAAGYCPSGEISAEYEENAADTSSLVSGDVAMIFLYSGMINAYQAAMTDTLGMTTFPSLDADAYSTDISQVFTIYNGCANPEVAADFISFFINNVEAGKILGTDRGVPCNSQVREALRADASPTAALIFSLFDATAPHGTDSASVNPPNDQAILEAWKAINSEVAYGLKTVEDGAAEFVATFATMVAAE